MTTMTPPLTELEQQILSFERMHTHWAYEGHREQAIRERFGMSRDEYALAVVRLLRRPEAEAHDAQTVRRLQRRVAARRR
jgi:hypothetical protein